MYNAQPPDALVAQIERARRNMRKQVFLGVTYLGMCVMHVVFALTLSVLILLPSPIVRTSLVIFMAAAICALTVTRVMELVVAYGGVFGPNGLVSTLDQLSRPSESTSVKLKTWDTPATMADKPETPVALRLITSPQALADSSGRPRYMELVTYVAESLSHIVEIVDYRVALFAAEQEEAPSSLAASVIDDLCARGIETIVFYIEAETVFNVVVYRRIKDDDRLPDNEGFAIHHIEKGLKT